MTDFDSPWKEALDWFFEEFMAFFFPIAHGEIDWDRGLEFLDKELQQIIKEAELGRRVVDKLVKVWLKNGKEEWILVHVEIQTQMESDFAERLFVYSYRLIDRYNRKVVSLAVLADDRDDWRPTSFGYAKWGFEIGVRFPIVKLLDFAGNANELANNPNPFAVVVLAHLKTLETRRRPEDRGFAKLALIKHLYEVGFGADKVRKLFRFIDWIMDLPDELARTFRMELHKYEKEKQMPYITSIERIGREEGFNQGLQEGRQVGRQEGRQEGLQEGQQDGQRQALIEAIGLDVEIKFLPQFAEIMKMVQAIEKVDALRASLKAIKTIQTPDEYCAFLGALQT